MKIVKGTWESSNNGDWTGSITLSTTSKEGLIQSISGFYKYTQVSPSTNKAKANLYIDSNNNGIHDSKDKLIGSQKSKYSVLAANPTADYGTFKHKPATGSFTSYFEGDLYGKGKFNSYGKKLLKQIFIG